MSYDEAAIAVWRADQILQIGEARLAAMGHASEDAVQGNKPDKMSRDTDRPRIDSIRALTGWDRRTKHGTETPGRYCILCGRELKDGAKSVWVRLDDSGEIVAPDAPSAPSYGEVGST